MLATTREARQIVKARRRANQKRTIATYVRKATTDTTAVKGVTAALRKAARDLRTTGQLGKVQTRTEKVAAGVIGKTYRYTAAQIARIAAAYRPRKAEYRIVAAKLALAA
ncbi:hypothetical protein OG455_41765 [Kitasatospora sp. NBC_01287]|uniref:hypothetical protein n=1 Tax=Kitasatospora sp. NBC_01287 TaxID=2903573 RepID=UPI0022585F7A|nr:hypothetical protein [Kitasatospora sp. NBC_01287]MCX4751736.1 hypothetical protein [Kitasatospora sp. NBC_01287]MCX4751972.1 hypothetical protein [Kitasatospora sp. NBC_01287]